MMVAIRAKKRDRTSMSTSHEDQDEYDRAVAFLREFHSRRVAAALHSTSLDAILEADRFDEIIASDFSLAMSVGKGSSLSTNDLLGDKEGERPMRVKEEGSVLQPLNNGYTNKMGRSLGTLSKMKKTATSTCLLDLDVTSASANDAETPSSRRGLYSHQECSKELEDADYYFGYGEESSPASKRRKGQGL